MPLLRDFLGTSIEADDETLILLRLMGRPFAKSFNIDVGEEPAAALAVWLRDGGGSRPFLGLLGKLLDPTFPPVDKEPDTLGRVFRQLEAGDRAAFAVELVRLLDGDNVPVDPDAVRALNLRFVPGPQITGPALSAFWHFLLSRYSASIIPDEEVAVSAKTILDPAFVDGPMVATARQRPYLFFGTIVPILFEAIRARDIPAESLPALPSAMRAGFAALYRDPVDPERRDRHLRLFAGQLEELVASGTGAFAVQAAVTGAVHATAQGGATNTSMLGTAMPFAKLALLEAGASRGRVRAGAMSFPRQAQLDDILNRYAESIRDVIAQSTEGRVDTALATNLVPYFEGIYPRIWQALLERAGVTIEMKEHRWGKVVPKLLDGSLSFAIWNDYVAPTYARNRRVIYRTNKPLLEYKHYPLVLRREALEKLLSPSLGQAEVSLVIAALTSDTQISPEEIEAHPELREALSGLQLGIVRNSEIEEIAKRALGDGFDGRHMQSDEAVECLVDGGLDGAFLGGVQAAYLSERFGHVMITLSEFERPTPMHLWFSGRTWRAGQNRLVEPLLHAWKVTYDIWKDARDPRSANHECLRDWILSLAAQLNYGVSGSEWGMRTPISSWQMISDLSGRHNDLCQPDDVQQHPAKRSRKQAPPPVVRSEVRNAAVKNAANDDQDERVAK